MHSWTVWSERSDCPVQDPFPCPVAAFFGGLVQNLYYRFGHSKDFMRVQKSSANLLFWQPNERFLEFREASYAISINLNILSEKESVPKKYLIRVLEIAGFPGEISSKKYSWKFGSRREQKESNALRTDPSYGNSNSKHIKTFRN